MESAHCLIAASSATSAIQPRPPVSRATAWTRWSRSTSATRAPRAASSRQQAAPMPLAPPVTTATPDKVALAIYCSPIKFGACAFQCACALQRQVAAFHGLVELDVMYRVAKHNLSLIDDAGMAGDAETEIHVLLGQQHRDTHVVQSPQQLADAFDDHRRQAFAGLIKQ